MISRTSVDMWRSLFRPLAWLDLPLLDNWVVFIHFPVGHFIITAKYTKKDAKSVLRS